MRGWVRVCVVVVGLAAWSAALAQSTGRSLDIQPGARQNGMGAAGVALESDPADAVWWNPAALGFAEWHGFAFSYAQLVPGLAADVTHDFVTVAGRVVPRLGIGASMTTLDYGSSTDSYGTWSSRELSGAVSAGYRVTPDLSFGATAKYVYIDFDPTWSANTGWGFDVGGLYRRTISNVRMGLGVNAQNLGPEVQWNITDASYPLGRNLKLGGSATMPLATAPSGLGADATAVLDYDHSLLTDGYDALHAGVELTGHRGRQFVIAARAGYYDDWKGDITDWTWGAGARVWGVSLDYAQIPQAKDSGLPNVEKVTFGLHTDALMEWLSARQPR